MATLQRNRTGEEGAVPSRCDRFYAFKNEWFFTTREGSPIGPFSTRETANSGLTDYLDFLNLASPKTRAQLVRSMKAS